MKWKNEIVEEVRRAKEAYAARFDYDLKRMFEDFIWARDSTAARTVWSFGTATQPPRD